MIILFFFGKHISLLSLAFKWNCIDFKHFIEARNWKLKNNNWAWLLQRKQDVIFSTRTSTLILLQDNRLKQKQKQKKQIKEFSRLQILKTNEVQINWNRKIHRLGERCGAVACERSPPTAVAGVRLLNLISHVCWVFGWSLSLLRGFFSESSSFPSST